MAYDKKQKIPIIKRLTTGELLTCCCLMVLAMCRMLQNKPPSPTPASLYFMVLSMLFHCSSRTYSPKCQCSNVYPSFQNSAEISLDQLITVLMPSLRSTPSCTIIACTLGSLRLVNAVWPDN